MPLAGPASIVDGQPPGQPIQPVVGPPAMPAYSPPTVVFYTPSGDELMLSGNGSGVGAIVLPGPAGLEANTYSFTDQSYPNGGGYTRWSHQDGRAITLPIRVYSDDGPAMFVDYWRRLVLAFMSTTRRAGKPGLGRLRIYRSDSTWREVYCRYVSGLEGQDDGAQGWRYRNAAVVLFAPDGRWYGPSQVGVTFAYAATANYYSPYETTSPAQTLGSQTIDVQGDVNSDPVWTLTGPYTSATITVAGVGSFTLANPVAAGHARIVDIAAGTVSDELGVNMFGDLNLTTSSLFELPVGIQQISAVLQGASAGASVQLAYRPAFETS